MVKIQLGIVIAVFVLLGWGALLIGEGLEQYAETQQVIHDPLRIVEAERVSAGIAEDVAQQEALNQLLLQEAENDTRNQILLDNEQAKRTNAEAESASQLALTQLHKQKQLAEVAYISFMSFAALFACALGAVTIAEAYKRTKHSAAAASLPLVEIGQGIVLIALDEGAMLVDTYTGKTAPVKEAQDVNEARAELITRIMLAKQLAEAAEKGEMRNFTPSPSDVLSPGMYD